MYFCNYYSSVRINTLNREVLFYESIDGDNWTYKNRFFDDSIGDMWECPDLFNVNGTIILVISPEQITKDRVNYTNN